jgi:hypothetical protein
MGLSDRVSQSPWLIITFAIKKIGGQGFQSIGKARNIPSCMYAHKSSWRREKMEMSEVPHKKMERV